MGIHISSGIKKLAHKTSLKRLIFMAMCITILFVQEQILTIIPNVQFSTLLIVLYVSLFKWRESVSMIVIYVILDNLYMNSFNPIYTPAMLIAWLSIPLVYHTVLGKTKSETKLAIFGLLFGFYYGWVFIPFRMFELGITEFWPYLMLDLPFQIIMAISNFLTILWLYKPLYKTLSHEMEAMGFNQPKTHIE